MVFPGRRKNMLSARFRHVDVFQRIGVSPPTRGSKHTPEATPSKWRDTDAEPMPKPNDLLRLEDAARLGFPAHPQEGKPGKRGLRSTASLARPSLSLKSTDGGIQEEGVGLYFQRAGRDGTARSLNAAWCIRDGPIKRRLGFGEGAPDDAPELKGALANYITRKIPRDRQPSSSEVMIADVIST
jgi:hypothetical protein